MPLPTPPPSDWGLYEGWGCISLNRLGAPGVRSWATPIGLEAPRGKGCICPPLPLLAHCILYIFSKCSDFLKQSADRSTQMGPPTHTRDPVIPQPLNDLRKLSEPPNGKKRKQNSKLASPNNVLVNCFYVLAKAVPIL